MKDDFWKGFARGLGMAAATVGVVGGVTLLTGGSGALAAGAIAAKLTGGAIG